MVLGYHVIFSAYGFWLPNDPRGSGSDFVASWDLFRYGPATKVDTRHSVAKRPHDRELRESAKRALKYPAVRFDGLQARAVGMGFAKSVQRGGVSMWACAILPDHVHLVFGRHRIAAERNINLLKGAATKELLAQRLHPFQDLPSDRAQVPMCWGREGWTVFLDSEADLVRSIKYVRDNPLKENKPPQKWSFVQEFPATV